MLIIYIDGFIINYYSPKTAINAHYNLKNNLFCKPEIDKPKIFFILFTTETKDVKSIVKILTLNLDIFQFSFIFNQISECQE